MKLAIAIVLLAAAIVAADLQIPFSFPAAKDFGLSDDCQRASDAVSPFRGRCLDGCGWNEENTTFTEIVELFEVNHTLSQLRAKLRDLAVRPEMAGCCTQTVPTYLLSLNDFNT